MLVTYLGSSTSEKPVSLKLISRMLGIPYRFLCQLAVEMKNGGILVSKEGRGGGYELVSNWAEIVLYDLMVILGENRNLVECLGTGGKCGQSHGCKQRKIWQELENKITSELKKIKLKDLTK